MPLELILTMSRSYNRKELVLHFRTDLYYRGLADATTGLLRTEPDLRLWTPVRTEAGPERETSVDRTESSNAFARTTSEEQGRGKRC